MHAEAVVHYRAYRGYRALSCAIVAIVAIAAIAAIGSSWVARAAAVVGRLAPAAESLCVHVHACGQGSYGWRFTRKWKIGVVITV